MAEDAQSREVTIAADELIARYGKRAAQIAAQWANSAHARGEIAKYEFWQWVCMDLNERSYQQGACARTGQSWRGDDGPL